MKTLLIAIIIITFPLFVNAQNFKPPQILPSNNIFPMQQQRPQVPQMPTMKPPSRSRVENAKAKLVREEQKLIKLAKKTWEKEAYLKTKQEKLKNLENTPENSNDPNLQKNIEIAKKQIAKSQDKLNEVKTKMEISSKKVEAFEIAVEEAKFKREEEY